MTLVNTHISPLFSMMQQSDIFANTPFWVIPAVILIALVVVLLLSIYDNEEPDNDAHDNHHHEPAVAETAVIAEVEAEEPVEAVETAVIAEVEAEEPVEVVGSTNEDVSAVEEKEVEPVETVELEEEIEETAVIPEPEEPEPVVPDNLRKIEGIGPKISGILNDAGILTFAQLAASSVTHLNKVVREDAGIRIAYPDTWPQQAQLAADGEWDALTTLQDSLIGGRHA